MTGLLVLTVVLLLAGALAAALVGAVSSELGRVGSDRALVLNLSREAGSVGGPDMKLLSGPASLPCALFSRESANRPTLNGPIHS